MADWIAMFDEQWVLDGPPDDAALTKVPARRGVLGLLAADDHPICLLTAADMRFASLSGTFVAVSNSHENNDGTHDDLSEKVTETLGEEVCLA